MWIMNSWHYIIMLILSVQGSFQDDAQDSPTKQMMKKYNRMLQDSMNVFLDTKLKVLINDMIENKIPNIIEEKVSRVIGEKLSEHVMDRFDELESIQSKLNNKVKEIFNNLESIQSKMDTETDDNGIKLQKHQKLMNESCIIVQRKLDSIEEKCIGKLQTTILKDIDECTIGNGGCEHSCNNTDGAYLCVCRDGYELRSDNKTCQDVKAVCESVDGVIVGDTCLYFSRERVSWSAAITACETKGGVLVSPIHPLAGAIHDYVKADQGHSLITGNPYFWVGASDTATEGSWVMVDGRPLGDQVPWYSGCPRTDSRWNCLAVDDRGYTDLICTANFSYICNLDNVLKTRN